MFSSDHKVVAKNYFFTSLLFLLLGGLLAMAMRWQLAWPGAQIPWLRNWQRFQEQGGMMPPEVYAEFFTQHGTIMIFFVVIPMLVGGFGNFLIPLHVGAQGMAFPRWVASAFWMHLLAGLVLVAGFYVPGGAPATGWTAYTPLSNIATQGQTWWIVSILLFGAAQVITAIAQATTIVGLRAPGMRWSRLPLSVWGLFATALLTIFSTPVLAAALIMLLLDRAGVSSFFSPTPSHGEGQPLLWQHLFWYYAHPAVYIMILPAMGFISDVLTAFARKPVFGYPAMVITTMAIASLGFLVWGHHMFQSGMNPYLGTTFMVATMAIAVPSAVKTFNWLATLWRGAIHLETPMLHAVAFISMFVIGGLSGVIIASTPVNVYLHDTYFIVGHLHYVLFGGSLFGIFAALYYWFPKVHGHRLDERLGRLHWLLTLITYNCTFFPMFLLGAGGMMRRMYDTTQYDYLRPLQPTNVFISASAFALAFAQLPFLANVLTTRFGLNGRRVQWGRALTGALGAAGLVFPVFALRPSGVEFPNGPLDLFSAWPVGAGLSALVFALLAGWYLLRKPEPMTKYSADNPWRANTLEWQISSPPLRTNYPELPTVYHGPYEYSHPLTAPDDFLPQNRPFPGRSPA